jgi:hypothetical protein
MKRRHIRRAILALSLTLLALAAGCGGSSASTEASSLELVGSQLRFAEYVPVPLLGPDSPAYRGSATPHSLRQVEVAKSLRRLLQQVPALAARLEKRGFAVLPAGSSLFQSEYEGNIYGGWPVYVTTDAAYNAWHLAFDKILRDLEQRVLLPKLERLLPELVKAAHAQAKALRGTPLAGDASRAEQLYELAAAEAGLPATLGPLARKEKLLVDAHTESSAISPLLGAPIDYSFFTPRGHYTLTPRLTRFFMAMSVLSQLGFCLPGTRDCPGVEPARIGILAAQALDASRDSASLWQQIYEPTSFLVGFADDYTPFEVLDATHAVVPASSTGPAGLESLASDAKVEAIMRSLESQRPVRISPQRASIRIMGTRFVIDEFLLDQLIYPHVGTQDNMRLVPSALDLAAVLGSDFAHRTMDAQGAGRYAHYDSQVKVLQAAVSARPADDWGSTVYDAWLAALQPVFVSHGRAFPDYMRTDAWAAKDLESGLGSYAELKHDTILFAKQLVAEAGGEVLPVNPRNWVEPEPVAFLRLASAADLLQQGLAQRNLLTPAASNLLASEIDLFRFLGRIASDELAGAPLAAVDNQRLRAIGDELSAIWWRTTDTSNPSPSTPDQSAIVADIASGPRGVLEIAVGNVDTIYVVVPDDHGGFELARGGVYSFYEFMSEPGQRLTDEAWRALLDQKKAPPQPSWEVALRVACPPGAGSACSPSYLPG